LSLDSSRLTQKPKPLNSNSWSPAYRALLQVAVRCYKPGG
jgi:hypothetical protein